MPADADVVADTVAGKLETFIKARARAGSVRIEHLRRLTGGASRETWSLDAVIEHANGRVETWPLILQRDVRGAAKALSREMEYHLLEAAYTAGVPAPAPIFFGDDSLGGEFFLVRRIDGETLPRRLLRDDVYADARRALPAQLGRMLAQIHAIDVIAHGLGSLPAPPAGASAAAAEVERYESVFRGIALEAHPAFELAFRWLRQRLPPDAAATRLVHGDYRMGNILFGPEGARAVLDWELAHLGDPMEDLAWVCVRSWRFGGEKPVGGIGERDEFFGAYESAGGGKVDRGRVHWWEVFGNLKWGIVCMSQARTHIDGVAKSIELAAIGRRTAETEWELLHLVSGD